MKETMKVAETRRQRTERQIQAARKVLAEYREKVQRGEAEPPRRGRSRWPSPYFGSRDVKDPTIRGIVNHYLQRTVAALGGEKNLYGGSYGMLIAQRACLLVILLAEQDLRNEGQAFSAKGEPVAAARTLAAYVNAFRRGQQALGLLRPSRDKRPQTLDQILEEYAGQDSAPNNSFTKQSA